MQTIQLRSILAKDTTFPADEPPTKPFAPSGKWIVATDRAARKVRAAIALVETDEVSPSDLAGTLREVVALLEGRAS